MTESGTRVAGESRGQAPRGESPGHAVVIGAGIVGLCTGAYLQRDGWRVTMIDPDGPGESCSFGNACMRSDGTGLPIATPGIFWKVPKMLMDPDGPLAIRWSYLPQLAPWLIRFVASSRRDRVEKFVADFATLMARARPSYEPLIEAAGARDLIRDCGSIEVFETKEAFDGARWGLDLRRKHGAPLEAIGPEQIRQIEPSLAPIFVGGIHRTDADRIINPLRLSQAIAELILREGGEIKRAAARAIRRGAGAGGTVVTEAEEIEADLIVVSAGAWSKKFAADAGARVPLDTERGYHVLLPNPGVEVRIPVKSNEGGFYLTPMELGLRIAGTDELAGVDAPPNYKRIDPMLRRAKRMVPELNTDGGVPWMGRRPSMPDSMPLISPVRGSPGIYLAFGHGHYGLTLAAVTGKAVADMVAGRPTDMAMAPFSADRF